MHEGAERLREFDARANLKKRAEIKRPAPKKRRVVVITRPSALRRMVEVVTRISKQV